MHLKMLVLRVFLTLSYVYHNCKATPTNIGEKVYVPPAFNKELLNTTGEDGSDKDSVEQTPTVVARNTTEAPDSRAFLNTAEQWFNFHLGTLAVAVPVNKYQELEFKWHVGVYSRRQSPYQQICGGSLVTLSVVISAAHCFWDDASTSLLPADQFAVAAGKRYRKWLKLQLHSSNVSEIIVPPRFLGEKTSFQDDVAVVRMSTAVSATFQTVRPLCVDFGLALDRKHLSPGSSGTITGFGLTDESGRPAQELNYQRLPYVDIRDCIRASEPSFLKYLTGDKICAGDQHSGRAVCRGDSGGGLIFFEGNATFNVPYLRGIASTAPRNDHECNAYAIGSFTHLRTHRTFLRDNIPGLEEECRTVYAKELAEIARNRTNIPDKADGTLNETAQTPYENSEVGGKEEDKREADIAEPNVNETGIDVIANDSEPGVNVGNHKDGKAKTEDVKVLLRTLPRPVHTIGESSAPQYQWHAAVYSKARKPYLQICGGTIVKRDVVISAAHCFKVESRVRLEAQFAVAAGKLHRAWGDPRDEFAQHSDVSKIVIPKDFRSISTKLRSCYQRDVAVLTLVTPFTYAPGVKPACVSFEGELDREHLRSGSLGKFVGWGDSQSKCALHHKLHYREMPYVDLGCIADFSLSNDDRIPDDDACGVLYIVLSDARVPAYIRINPPCDIDSGGGLMYFDNRTIVPYLRGVATATIKGNRCNHYILDSFTHLRPEMKFLKTAIPGLEEECDVAYPKDVGDGVEREKTQKSSNETIKLVHGDSKQRTLNKTTDRVIFNVSRERKFDTNSNISWNINSIGISNQTVESNILNTGNSRVNLNVYHGQVPLYKPSDLRNVKWEQNHQPTLMKPVSDMISNAVMESKTVELVGNSSRPAFPWHVGIYSKAWTPYMQICGGSLVKRDVVLSAAHCFWSNTFGPQAPAQFAAAAGKLHRPWMDARDEGAQHSHVSELIFPDRFIGLKTSYQDDIVVVRLTTPFEYGARVKPICVDFDTDLEKLQLRNGALGKFAGWGLTQNNGEASDRLNYIVLPYLEIKECLGITAPASLKYVTSDKICAGEPNIARYICRSDAGGGLAYVGSPPTIRGISSQALDGLCDAVTLTRFTIISSHAAFLREHVAEIESECQDVYGLYGHSDKGPKHKSRGLSKDFTVNLVCNCNCDNSSRYTP